ncbi:MAG TPA: methylmalonyl-CoA mutase family protein, partial [Myxococcaceae bacterium]|nr:methylmalonyl-CoA mutase family protein [Myxococcaceae bacterium]
ADFIDPLGGAYALEQLTDELEARALEYIRKIDALGGMVEAINKGYPQQEIQDAAYDAQRAVETKQQLVVGVNAFQVKEPPPSGLLRVDEEVEQRQARKMKQLRDTRDNASANRAVDALRQAAKKEDENLIPLILDAVKAEATLGEISDALRDVFGEHREHVVL